MPNSALSAAATGMMAQNQNVAIIANDIANMNTTGFKANTAVFATHMVIDTGGVGSNSSSNGTIVPTGIQTGLGTKLVGISKDNSQGEPLETKNPTDIMISGKGFFQITLPDGEIGYTRDGKFQLSPNGELVTIQGFPLTPNIIIPPQATDIAINAEGQVMARISGQTAPQSLGTIELASFLNPSGLRATENNLHLQTTASGTPTVGNPGLTGMGTLLQGFIERSNVTPVVSLVNLTEAQRAYELNAKVIKTADQMMAEIRNITG